MSVYTEVGRTALEQFLDDYDLGKLISYQGISAGIENTNYFVTTSQGEFVLTLFEQHEYSELAYFLNVMTFFYQQGIPSAHPAADKQGNYLKKLAEKPAALVNRLAGGTVDTWSTPAQCQAIGDRLGQMHLAGQQFPSRRPNSRGAHWRKKTGKALIPHLDSATADMLAAELAFQQNYADLDLPWGVVHSDLFRDNALFDGDQLSGIIDFYYACDDYLLYDLAVAVNDWCVAENGLLETTRYQRLMQAYIQRRPLTAAEITNWNLMLRAAALRFWLSRLQDQLFPREGELTQIKNPDAFLAILRQHQQQIFPADGFAPS
ncbi:Homoserine kinase [Methylophaga frappieri]|uniref:Homoserine kinase n=1 Tax=Methylophaga frappieri (strain ATCC BAA-2434 / DSM 25690 / JAM7) TaxID=754477 RepID=I1YKC9_METFJ|nr:homoserine kinase [Methylophaga frappieri]AFJ03372.1 Homoserine kinase [Methylophaga frappieri]